MLVSRTLKLSILLAGVGALLSVPGAAQIFVKATSAQIPATGSFTENVDFGDIDRDGDWDVFVADGGDLGNDQNRVYVNMGGPAGIGGGGTIGFFQDKTALLLPVVADDSRDIEFADFDSDGDIDSYTSNTAQVSNQSNRWWINRGGQQGGVEGFYDDETSLRWIGLGGASSSIGPSQVLASGGFIDWSCDCDFADLDNDGDVDLFHSTYGGSFVGNVPSRVFLNDGEGFFSEFNPSGIQLSGVTILDGTPGLWCQGMQQQSTADLGGSNCDIAATPLGVEIADTDGDLDLDVLHGSRNDQPRMFENRLAENGGALLGFRDVTGLPGAMVGAAWTVAADGGNYEQELGDMDNDADVDAYMLNYVGFEDDVFNNPGDGLFGSMQVLPSSGSDDNEGDFLDYDADGDLDLVIAAFSGNNRLYQNQYAGGAPGSFSYLFIAAATSGFVPSGSLDSDCADVDADGDYDNLTAEDGGGNEILYLNTLTSNDVSAPYFGRRDNVGDQTAAVGSLAIRTQAYDNTPYYINWYNEVNVELTVDGCRLPDLAAASSQGQIFRALLPKNLVGSVSLAWRSTDEHGNSAVSSTTSYTGSTALAFQSHYGAGTAGTTGTPTIDALSVPFAGSTLHLAGKGLPAGTQWWLVIATAPAAPAPLVIPGLVGLNLSGSLVNHAGGLADASGCGAASLAIPAAVPAGIDVYAQFFGLNGTGGSLLSASDGLRLTSQ